MYKSAKWKSYWLIETDIRKTLQASAFSFTVLNLAEKAFLHFPFNYAGLYKERSTEVGGGGGGGGCPPLPPPPPGDYGYEFCGTELLCLPLFESVI